MIPFCYMGHYGEPANYSVLNDALKNRTVGKPSRAELRQDVDRCANEMILHASEGCRWCGYPTREEYDVIMEGAHEAADAWRERAHELLKAKKLAELADEVSVIDTKIAFSRANLRVHFGDDIGPVPH